MKAIPNYISFSRIIFFVILLFINPLSPTFYMIYIIGVLSDVLDGFIARKTGTSSSFGARLDSAADMVMAGVLIIVFYPVVKPAALIVVWIILICIIRLAGMGIALKKYKTFASIHTYGNKITGMILGLFPILILYIDMDLLVAIVCVVASITAIEELMIQVTSKQLELDRKSIFEKMT